MPPVPEEAFASELRGLSTTDRTQFVADLWSARGWETTVEDGVVVAERDDERRRIRVVAPGRFGTPDVSGVDVLVSARDREGVRETAEAADVEYVPSAELRDLLLYGVEREAAASLYEEWFDRPLMRTAPDESDGRSVAGSVAAALPPIAKRRRTVAVVLLVGLVGVVVAGPALSGVGAPDQSPVTVANVTPDEETPGAIGAASPEPTEPPGLLPGVNAAGIDDVSALVEAHVAGVRNRSRVRSVTIVGPPNASIMGGTTRRTLTTWIDNRSHYRHESASQFPGADGWNGSAGVYADGEVAYQRVVIGNDSAYSRYPVADRPASQYDDVAPYLYRYFTNTEATVVTCAIRFETDCPTYRIEVDEPPAGFAEGVEEFDALAIVSDRGVITTMRVNYTITVDGERATVELALNYQFESVDPEPPEWLPDAKNETANRTATEGGTTPTATGTG
jgi:hypothetical protein